MHSRSMYSIGQMLFFVNSFICANYNIYRQFRNGNALIKLLFYFLIQFKNNSLSLSFGILNDINDLLHIKSLIFNVAF
jgi:hypothetical protein